MGCGLVCMDSSVPHNQQFQWKNAQVMMILPSLLDISNLEEEKKAGLLFQSASAIESKKYQQAMGSSFQEHQTILEILLHPDIDRRHLNKHPLQYPYNCIGILCFIVAQNTHTATGFLVSPNAVLTAAHFLEAYSRLGKLPMKFILKQNEGQTGIDLLINSNKIVQYRYPAGYTSVSSPIQQDYGMALLQRQIKMQSYLPLGVNYNCKHSAQVFGFPAELTTYDQYKMIGMKGAIISVTDDYLQYDIDTIAGESGSPVLVELIQSVIVAVGIHSGYYSSCFSQGKIIKRQIHPPNQLNVTKDKYNSACKFNSSNIQQLKLYSKQMEAIPFQIIDLHSNSNQLAASKCKINLLAQEQINQMAKEVQSTSGTPNKLIRNCKRLSKYFYERERFNISLPYCEKGLRLADTDLINQAQFYNLMGLNYQELNQFETAQICYNRSLAIIEHRINEDPKGYAQVCNNLGTLLLCLQEGKTKAQAYFEAAERILREKRLTDNEQYIATLTNLGLIKRKFIKTPQKIDQYQSVRRFKSALQIDQRIFERLNISTSENKAIIYYNLSQCFFEAQKFDDWLRYSAESLAILRLFDLQNHSTCKVWKYQILQKIDLFLKKQLTKNLVWKLIYFIHEYLKPRDQKIGRKQNSQYNPQEYSWQYDSLSTSSQSQIQKIMTYHEKEEDIQFKLSQILRLHFQGQNNQNYQY